jgi:serine-type D-Ala-D-Ala carboxypeptidase
MNERISAFLAERIAANDFPSAVYLVAEKGEIVFHDALGNAVVEPEVIPARLETIYDLASLTKPLVTGLLFAKFLEDDELYDVDTTLNKLIQWIQKDKEAIRVRDLVAHTSGLRAWYPFYTVFFDPNRTIEATVATALELPTTYERGSRVVYSDLNFILLSEILRNRELSSFLSELVQTELIVPLRLSRTFFNPDISMRREIAASEMGNEYEKQTCIEKGYLPGEVRKPDREGGLDINGDSYALANARASANLRTRQIWGEVHDGNAYFMGGVAGHAGLFSTAEEVYKIALQFLPEHTKLLKPATCELFRTNFTPGMNEDRSFAFQLASTKDSTAGTRMSPESFGHNGFTGTSLWIDPVMDRIFVLLTNRTHAHPLPFVNINSVRRRFHDLAIEELERS